MKDIKIEDLLKLLEETEELKKFDRPIDDFHSFIKHLDLKPGSYKLNINVLKDIYKDRTNNNVPKNIKELLKALGYKVTSLRKNYYTISVSKGDKERLTLEYATKISEKIYKDN